MPQPGIESLFEQPLNTKPPGPLDSKSYTLPRRYKSRLVPQGSTSVSYTYHYYIIDCESRDYPPCVQESVLNPTIFS